MGSRKKKWRYAVGERGHTVVVYERRAGGPLYARWPDPTAAGERRRVSLEHRDREKAIAFAHRAQRELVRDGGPQVREQVTLSVVFAAYLAHRSPRKRTNQGRQADKRRANMWEAALGSDRDPHAVCLRDWEAFIDARGSGAIDSAGNHVTEKKRRSVRARTVEADCDWLRSVFNWAALWRLESGQYLMRENPVRGFDAPTEKNPRRPVASHDRYEAIRAVTDDVTMEVRWDGRRETRRSYLSEVFDIAMDTGRRLSAVCQLRYADLRLSEGTHGKIHWPGDTDKEGREWNAPLAPIARAAIDRVLRDRPGVGSGYLFPSPITKSKPISRHLADSWLRKAEKKAKLTPQSGSLWYSYRRKWATERKHLPDVDVAEAGGWKSVETLKLAYQHADDATMERVVLEPKRLREAK